MSWHRYGDRARGRPTPQSLLVKSSDVVRVITSELSGEMGIRPVCPTTPTSLGLVIFRHFGVSPVVSRVPLDDTARTGASMTNRLGSTPEYGGSARELPRREAESRSGTALRGRPSELRTGAGRRSAPVLSTTTFVEATTDDLVKAIRALSTLAGPVRHPGRGRRRVDVQRTSVRAGRQSLDAKERA